MTRRLLLALGLILFTALGVSQAGPVMNTKGRCGNCTPTPPPTGEWASTYITNITQAGPALTNGTTVGVKIPTTYTGMGQQLTSGNGATMDIVVGGSFDGLENAARIYPPTACIGGPCDSEHNAEYASFLRNMDIWNNMTRDVKQVNMRVLVYYGPRYFDLAPNAKSWGFQISTELGPGGDQNNRVGVYDIRDPGYTNWKYPYEIISGWQVFCNPNIGGYLEECPLANKLIEVRGSPNHAASPPQTGGEWICVEEVIDVSRVRGNPDGLARMLVTTRDGVVNQRQLIAPLSYNEDWDFNAQYIYLFEGLGFYFNSAGTANANNFIMFSHPTFAVNMANSNTLIGCENIPGFLQ